MKSKQAPAKQSTGDKKVSSKEHEDALDLFVRDDSDDELSDVSSEDVQMKGDELPDLSGDDENDDWEDVDLSHTKMSLDDLNGSTETPDLEVTLERTQLSMRIKCCPFVTTLTSRNKAFSAAERKIRMHTHLLHIQCLLVHGAIRNAWLEDKVLQVDATHALLDVRMTCSPLFQT
jgi:xeroderma pigmentosum group C-complementing protein